MASARRSPRPDHPGPPPLEGEVSGQPDARRGRSAALLFLPPYSPDLNPIEQLFAKLQALLRHIAARTKDELWEAIGRLLVTVPVSECVTTSTHCCYSSI
jgi:transposase